MVHILISVSILETSRQNKCNFSHIPGSERWFKTDIKKDEQMYVSSHITI